MQLKMQLKVWWIPQVPMTAFEVSVECVADGVLIMDTLADYDKFQFEHHIKPDYCNTGGLLMSQDGVEWEDWWIEEYGKFFDDPREYLAFLDS